MKIRSEEKDVYFERLRTPLTGASILTLKGVLQAGNYVHFFFEIWKEKYWRTKKRDIHVMTIGAGWPYRLIEEEYAYACLGKYFERHGGDLSKKRNRKPQRTWKLWGTSFIKELDEGRALSNYESIPNKNIVEYLVITEDEWIEWVECTPVWCLLRNTTAKSAMKKYLEMDLQALKRKFHGK